MTRFGAATATERVEASIRPVDPYIRAAADDEDDAIGEGVAAIDPAEGDHDEPGEGAGSPRG